jgi:hypothetical protein
MSQAAHSPAAGANGLDATRWSPDAIERAVAHKGPDKIRGIYSRDAIGKERVDMAQWWADYLDGLRAGV